MYISAIPPPQVDNSYSFNSFVKNLFLRNHKEMLKVGLIMIAVVNKPTTAPNQTSQEGKTYPLHKKKLQY